MARYILLFLLLFFVPPAFGASGITYHGRLLKPDGTPVLAANVQFRLQIYTPGAEDCLLYEEIQNQDLSLSNGLFALSMGDGLGARQDSNGWGMFDVFSNRRTFTFGAGACSTGTSYNPSALANRKFKVSFNDGTFTGWESLPTQSINFIPFSVETYAVGGFPASSLLRVEDSGTLGSTTPITSAQMTELLALINGSSAQYSSPNELNGSALPAIGSGQSVRWNGSAWEAYTPPTNSSLPTCTAGQVLFSNGSALSCVTGGGGGGSISDGDDITSGTIGGTTAWNTSGSITTTGAITGSSLSGSTVSTRGLRVFESTNTNYVSIQAPAGLTPNYTLTLPANDGGSGEVLSTNGSGVLSWISPGATNINLSNIRSTINSMNQVFPSTACTTAQTLRYDSLTDTYQCSNITVAASAVTGAILDGGNTTGAAVVIGTNDAQSLQFETNNLVGMTLRSSGKIGIGTNDPTSRLSLFADSTDDDGDDFSITSYSNTTSGAYIARRSRGTASAPLAVQPNDILMSIGGSGYTGSAFAWGGALALVAESDYSVSQNSAWRFATVQAGVPTEKFRITSAGNVGIGTNNPATKLQVMGTIKISNGAESCSAAGDGGMIRYNAGALEFCNGSAWQTLGVSGAGLTSLNGLTSSTQSFAIGSAGTAPAFSSATSTHTLNIPMASAASVTAGLISKTDYDTFNAKLSAVAGAPLASGQTWVGNGSSVAAARYIGIGDIKTSLGTQQFPSSCTSAQTMTWSAVTDVFSCTNIAIASTQVSGLDAAYFKQDGNSFGAAATLGTNDAFSLQFETNGTQRMIIGGSSGNIGIGTAIPNASVDVFGTSSPSIRITNSTSAAKANFSATTYGGLIAGNSADLNLTRWRGSLASPAVPQQYDTLGSITAYGGSDPTTYTPAISSKIQFDAEETFSATASGGSISFLTQATGSTGSLTERMKITADGSVGIGTTTPAALFHTSKSVDSAVGPLFENPNAGTAAISTVSIKANGSYGLFEMYGSNYSGNWSSSGISRANSFAIRTPAASPASHMFIGPSSPAPLYLATNSLPRVTVTPSGDVGIGTTNPTAKLEVVGTIKATGFEGPLAATSSSVGAGSNTAPSIAFTGDTNTGFYNASSNDTISVATDGTNIFNFTSTGLSSPTTGGANITTANGTASAPTFSFAGDADTGWFRPAADTLAASTAGTERIRIDSTGNIGIGTTSPTSPLNISFSNNNVTAPTSVAAIKVQNNDLTVGNMASVLFNEGTAAATSGAGIAALFEEHDTTPATSLLFHTSNGTSFAERMRISSAGNVGIGTAVPGTTLHVYSPNANVITVERNALINSGIEYKNTGGSMYAGLATNLNFAVGSGSNLNSGSFHVTPTGNVGIGTSAPSTSLEVASAATSGAQVQLTASDTGGRSFKLVSGGSTSNGGAGKFTIYDHTAAASRLVIDGSGYVGIGTAAPLSGLNIVGTGGSNDDLMVDSYGTTNEGTVMLRRGRGTASAPTELLAGDRTGILSFRGHNGSTFVEGASIMGYAETDLSVAQSFNMRFATRNNGSFTERMRLSSEGNLGIGTTAPAARLDVNGGIRATEICDEAGANCRDLSAGWGVMSETVLLQSGTAAAPSLAFSADPDTGIYRSGTNGLAITTGGTMAASFDASGNINMAGNIGVKDASPSASTAINSSITVSANGTRYGTNNGLILDNSAALTTNRSSYGVLNDVSSNLTETNRAGFNLSLYGAYNRSRASSTAGTDGAATSMYGSYNLALNQSSSTTTIGAMHGAYGVAQNTSATGDVTAAAGLYGYVQQNNAATTMTNAYGVRTLVANSAGAITNGYGLYSSFSGTFGTKYGVYSTGEDRNYFSGDVGIGTATPLAPLHVFSTYNGEATNYLTSLPSGIAITGAGGTDQVGLSMWDRDGDPGTSNDGDGTLWWGDDAIDSLRFAYRANGQPLSEKMRITASGDVGIGTTNPVSLLQVGNELMLADPRSDIYFVSHGYITADNNLFINIDGDDGSTNGVFAIGTDRTTSSGGTELMRVQENGNVGIGTTNATHKLHVVGTAGLSTGTAWTNTSDRRLKDIQGNYEYGLHEIMKLQTVRFNYKKGNSLGLPSDVPMTGFIAQEVQSVIPDAVHERDDGYLELNVDPIHWATVNAVKELGQMCEMSQDEIQRIKSRQNVHERKLASLEAESAAKDLKIKELEKRLEILEKYISNSAQPKAKAGRSSARRDSQDME